MAVDAAKGLEYIHEHTKVHYVHRDIKTSNILIDGFFRAKVFLFHAVDYLVLIFFCSLKSRVLQISNFGLSKLIGKAGETEGSATRVVGTFGYLAPE